MRSVLDFFATAQSLFTFFVLATEAREVQTLQDSLKVELPLVQTQIEIVWDPGQDCLDVGACISYDYVVGFQTDSCRFYSEVT